MFEVLREYFKNKVELSDDEFELLTALFIPKKMRKGQFLQHEREIPRYAGFVSKGCLRKYTIDNKGKEHIIQFAPENWWIGDLISIMKGEPSIFNIDAIDDSEILLLDKASQEKFTSATPKISSFFHVLLQNNNAAYQKRLVDSMSAPAEERYQSFVKTYPSIVQRVPQHMIASYLGITAESLSRIRKKLSERPR